MDTTEELFETTEEKADASVPAETAVNPDLGDEMEIPEDFFKDIKEEDYVLNASEENDIDPEIFRMDFSDVERQEAKEAKREEKKALKKQQRKSKHWFNLMVRIMAIVLGPILVISLFYIIDSVASAKKLTHKLVQGEMDGLAVSAVEAFSYIRGDYAYTDGVFYKGTTDLESMYEYLDNMSKKANVDVMVFFGDTCVMTTFCDESGARYSGVKIDSATYENIVLKYVYKGNYYFNSNATFNGEPYATYYYPLMQESTGEVIGAIFCGVSHSEMNKDMNGILTSLIVFGIIFAVGAAVLCFFEVRKMTKAMDASVVGLTRLSEGDLTVRITQKDTKRKDEIGDIARGVKKLSEDLNEIVGSVRVSSKEVSDFSEMMNVSMGRISETVAGVNLAVEDIAKGATSQATETMQANGQVAQIGDAIEVAVTEVGNLSVSAKKMDEYSIEADKTLQELLVISKEADEAINEIKRQTNETNASAQQIQKATDMIAAIASQTNLLSLNASIEAARAGEAGMGFAVVADEIRQLAEQSRASAEEIRESVEVLIRNSDTSVKTMNNVSESIITQNDKLDETLKVFGALDTEVASVMNAIKEIAVQTQTLADLRVGVVSIVEGLAAIAEENAAGAQETSASMYEVSMILEECTRQTQELVVLKEELEKNLALFAVAEPEEAEVEVPEEAVTEDDISEGVTETEEAPPTEESAEPDPEA